MKTFTVVRNGDESGVSGTGRILDGALFHNGKVAVCWRTDTDGTKYGDSSIGIYDSFGAFRRIHIDSHPDNKTEIHWNQKTSEMLDELIDLVQTEKVDELELGVKKSEDGKRFSPAKLLRNKVVALLVSMKPAVEKTVLDAEEPAQEEQK